MNTERKTNTHTHKATIIDKIWALATGGKVNTNVRQMLKYICNGGGRGELETDRNVFFLNHGKFIVDTKSKTSGGHNKRKSQ